jgi:hypothetical protein
MHDVRLFSLFVITVGKSHAAGKTFQQKDMRP